jgi:hypothetical protein
VTWESETARLPTIRSAAPRWASSRGRSSIGVEIQRQPKHPHFLKFLQLGDLGGAVGAAVVHHQNLEGLCPGLQIGLDAGECCGNPICLVIGRDDDTQGERLQ